MDGGLKITKLGTFFIIEKESAKIWPNGWHHSIQRVKEVYLRSKRYSNSKWSVSVGWGFKNCEIRNVFNH